ncbi:MAG: RNA polymerase sigma factor [Vicinamibacterales bacterium]
MLSVDGDLFAAAQAGDRAALERLPVHLRPDIQRYARFQCYASSSIEDVVQEALIVVYRRVGDIRNPAALGAWLVKVIARLCALPALMFMRSVEELKTIEDSARFAHVPVDELRMDVARALAALPERHRQILLLRDFEELTISEIARHMAISGEAAKSLLRRARAAVRQCLTAGAPAHGSQDCSRSAGKEAP